MSRQFGTKSIKQPLAFGPSSGPEAVHKTRAFAELALFFHGLSVAGKLRPV